MLRPARVSLALSAALGLALTVLSAPATAHEERPAEFPDGTGERPAFLGYDNPDRRVVCKPGSERRIAALPQGRARDRSERLLEECGFTSIQSAINTIRSPAPPSTSSPASTRSSAGPSASAATTARTSRPAVDEPLAAPEYIGSLSSPDTGAAAAEADDGDGDGGSGPIALSYYDQRGLPHQPEPDLGLRRRTPKNDSISCDSQFCGTQIVGTGAKMTDVRIDNASTSSTRSAWTGSVAASCAT